MGNEVNTIRVAMLGARRVGKSSVLASMIDQFDSVAQSTGLKLTAETGTQELISMKLASLKNKLDKCRTRYGQNRLDFQMDEDSTPSADCYTFVLSSKDTNGTQQTLAKVEFRDVPGEDMCDTGEKGKELVKNVADADVLMIAVDSVHLMEKGGAYSQRFNRVQETENVLRRANFPPEDGSKLVLFVPLKCEKYYYDSKMAQVRARVLEEYARIIQLLTTEAVKDRVTVAVTPILTMGGIEFSRFGTDESGKVILVEESIPQLFRRPKEVYYRMYDKLPTFHPIFCEQPVLYLLSFIVEGANKAIRDKNLKIPNSDAVIIARRVLYIFVSIICWFLDFSDDWKDTFKKIFGNPKIKRSIELVRPKTKTRGDGYQVIHDPFGIAKS